MLKKILRILVGFIFILSGFVKAVDLVGFSFKLEEYFEPGVFNLPFLLDFALPIAIFVVGLELILGIMLLLNIRLKFTLSALIALCIFFGFLTFYSAYFNVVTDCGCFGDAIKFTPWESFVKDIILLLALLLLFLLYRKELRAFSLEKSTAKAAAVFIFTAVMTIIMYWGIMHEPLIDFRDYKIGTDLVQERKKIDQNPSDYKVFYTLKNQKTQEELILNQDDFVNDKKYWEEGTPWETVEGKTETKLVKQGYKSEIGKFKLESAQGTDLTNEVLTAQKAILLFCYNPKNADPNIISQTEARMKDDKNAYLLGISTDPKVFKTINTASMDGTAMKTIARSNPFILILENGKITQKLSAEDYLATSQP